MAESNLEPTRRLIALRKASEAHTRLAEVRHAWSLWAQTRPYAQQLAPILEQVAGAVHTLSDSTADHWSAATVLRSAVQACDGMTRAELVHARQAMHDAYQQIAGN
ncbi:MAG: hypothetical protein ACREVO_00730 [Steroidobacteraceae bacterium]